MVQELIPGDGRQRSAYCAFFKGGEAIASMVARRRRQHPPELGRTTTFAETIDLPLLEELSLRFPEGDRLLRPRGTRVRAEPPRRAVQAARRERPHVGLPHPWATGLESTSVPCCSSIRSEVPCLNVSPSRAFDGFGWSPTCPPVCSKCLAAGCTLARVTCDRCVQAQIESVFCREDMLPGLMELALVPYLYLKRGF